jgi:hypothetical protein
MPAKDDYTGPYALGEPYAKVRNSEDEDATSLACPKCSKKLKSTSGFTLHLKKCCPENLGKKKKKLKPLSCPKCSRELKSASAHTLHIKKCCPEYLNRSPYQERLPHHPKGVWELELSSFHKDLKLVDPAAYFITTGEAIIKADKLCEDLQAAFHAAERLRFILKELRGEAKYMETQWEMNRLLLKKKNPRASSRNSIRKKGRKKDGGK